MAEDFRVAARFEHDNNPALDFAKISADKGSHKNAVGSELIPAAKFSGLAGLSGGLTELTFNQVNARAAETLEKAAGSLNAKALSSKISYEGLDSLVAHKTKWSGITLESSAFNKATQAKIDQLIESSQSLANRDSTFQTASKDVRAAQMRLGVEETRLVREQRELQKGLFARADLRDIMHNDTIIRSQMTPSSLATDMTAEELRGVGRSFNETSLFRKGLLDKAANMAPGELVKPQDLMNEVMPAWRAQLDASLQADKKMSLVGDQLRLLNEAEIVPHARIQQLASAENRAWSNLPINDPIKAQVSEYVSGVKVLNIAKGSLYAHAAEVGTLSLQLGQGLRAEAALAENTAVASFVRGFGKGFAGMSLGIGAGYMADQLMGRGELAINSPAGLAIDALGGMALVSKLPSSVKLPLALATIATPRVIEATGFGKDFLSPTTFAGSSEYKPNAVDALGLGLAAGLPVATTYKMAIGAAAIVTGRVYNAAFVAPENKYDLLKR